LGPRSGGHLSQELPIPTDVLSDKNAWELIRAWAAHAGLVCSPNPEAWPKDQAPVAWGILLSDVARHVADALHQAHGQLRDVFDKELDQPSAETKGNFV
jgi:Domain of unknown function (DUF5076)